MTIRNLYEIRTGYVGESYVRAYAWATSEEEAERLFFARNPSEVGRGRLTITLLFSETMHSFCTVTSDEGFEDPYYTPDKVKVQQ